MRNEKEFYDVDYGLASAAITSTGKIIASTTSVNYHGASLIAGTTRVSVVVYDHASDTAGNIIDTFVVYEGDDYSKDKFIPIKAKKGLTLAVTGTGATGVVFFGPKG